MPQIADRHGRMQPGNIRRFLIAGLIAAAGLGYMELGDIPFHLKIAPEPGKVMIRSQSAKLTAETMAREVTLPLENALMQLPQLNIIKSVTTSDESLIELQLSENNIAVSEILRIFSRPGVIPFGVSVPEVYQAGAPVAPFQIAFWTTDSVLTRKRMVHILDSLLSGAGLEYHIKMPVNVDSGSKYRFSEGTSLAYKLQEIATGDTSDYLFINRKLLYRNNLLYPKFKEAAPEPAIHINGFPAITCDLIPEGNSLLLRAELKAIQGKMRRNFNISTAILHDPYASVINSLKLSGIRLAVLMIVAIGLLVRFRKWTILFCLTLPGIYFLLHHFTSTPLSVYDIRFLEMILIAWCLILFLKPDVSMIYKCIICLAIPAITAGVVSPLNPEEKHMLTGFGLACLCFLMHLPLACNTFKRNECRVNVKAFPAVCCILYLGGSWILFESSETLFSPIHKTLKDHRPLPPDQETSHKIISIFGSSTNATTGIGKHPIEKIKAILSSFQPLSLIILNKSDHEVVINAEWASISSRTDARLRNALTQFLDDHDGISWQLEGSGRPYQNHHLLVPGTYSFQLSGFDYDKLLLLGQNIGDSIQKLPGVGLCRVNYDALSDISYYLLTPKDGRNKQGILPATTIIRDSSDIMHSPIFNASGMSPPPGEFYSFTSKKQTAPVTRKNNQYIIPVSFSHYGREKYARQFYEALIRNLSDTLPFGFGANNLITDSESKRTGFVYLLPWIFAAVIICVIIQCPAKSLLLNTFFLLLCTSLLFRCIQGCAFSYSDSQEIMFMLLIIIIASYGTAKYRSVTITLLLVIYLLPGLCYGSGKELTAIQNKVCLLAVTAGYFTLEYGWLISRRGNSIKQLFNLFRFGVVPKLFK